MTMDEIFKTMQDLIAEQFAIDTDEIGMDSSFVDDLGAPWTWWSWSWPWRRNSTSARSTRRTSPV